MSRCQRRIVSGVTSNRSPWRRAFGITLSKAASSARSAQVRCGRRGCRRCRTASGWRRIKISAVCHASSRWDSRSHVVTRVMRRNANRRHMTGDHHGRGAGRATLLARAVDAILGTHKPPACYRASWQLPGPDFHRQATTSLRTARSAATSQRHLPLCWAHEKPGLDAGHDSCRAPGRDGRQGPDGCSSPSQGSHRC
jgi:hypothetical protein